MVRSAPNSLKILFAVSPRPSDIASSLPGSKMRNVLQALSEFLPDIGSP